MKIKTKKVLLLDGIGFFAKDGEEWEGMQKWSRIDVEKGRLEYFISYNGFDNVMINQLFGQYEDEDLTINVLLATPELAGKIKDIK